METVSSVPFRRTPLIWQLAMATAGMATLAFAPPSQGQMLLLPMTEAAAAALPRLATANGSLIVGRGPVAGSLVIEGRRATVFAAALSSAILVVAAPQVGCGARGLRAQARI